MLLLLLAALALFILAFQVWASDEQEKCHTVVPAQSPATPPRASDGKGGMAFFPSQAGTPATGRSAPATPQLAQQRCPLLTASPLLTPSSPLQTQLSSCRPNQNPHSFTPWAQLAALLHCSSSHKHSLTHSRYLVRDFDLATLWLARWIPLMAKMSKTQRRTLHSSPHITTVDLRRQKTTKHTVCGRDNTSSSPSSSSPSLP
jgi:hypothetical protein